MFPGGCSLGGSAPKIPAIRYQGGDGTGLAISPDREKDFVSCSFGNTFRLKYPFDD